MSHERRAKWIGRFFWIVLIGLISAGVWFYQKPEEPDVVVQAPEPVENQLLIKHHHLEGNAQSEEVAEILKTIQERYGPAVLVVQVILADSDSAESADKFGEGIPDGGDGQQSLVEMSVNGEKEFEFRGFLSEQEITRKVEEILAKILRFRKGWLPDVPGMTPVRR